MKKSLIVFLVVMVLSFVTFASTISVWFSWEGQNEFLSIVKGFEKAHPDVHVNVVYVPRMIQKLRITLAANGTFPDIALVRNDYIGILVDAKKIQSVEVKNVAERFRDAFTMNNDLYAYPYYGDVQVIYINKDVFKKVGISLPSPSTKWTLNDLENIAQRIKSHGYIGILLNSVASYFFDSFNAAFNDGEIPQLDGIPIVTTKGTLEAAELYDRLFNKEKIAVSYKKMALVNAFKTGKAGMMFMGSFLIKDFLNSGLNFSIAPYPYLDEDKTIPPVLDPKGFVVFKKSSQITEFLDYVTSAEREKEFCLSTYKLPANSEASEALGSQNEFFKVMNISAKRAIVLPTSKVFKEGYVKAVETALNLYLSGKMNLKTAFEKAQEYIEAHK